MKTIFFPLDLCGIVFLTNETLAIDNDPYRSTIAEFLTLL